MKKSRTTFTIGKRTIPASLGMRSPNSIDNESIVPLSLIADHKTHSARLTESKSSTSLLDIRAAATKGIALEIGSAELTAEKELSYERLAIITKDGKTVQGHEAVQKASEAGKSVLVLQLEEEIDFVEEFLIQLRYSSKEGVLSPRAKSEAYRFGHDELGLSVAMLRRMSVKPKGTLPTESEITSDIRTGRIYHSNPNFKVDFLGYTLDERPHSNIKYLVGNNEIYQQMTADPAKEQHFIRMAVTQSHSGEKRLQDIVPKLLKHDDTKEALFNSGIIQAKELLKAKYPEENRALHPYFDFQSAVEKLDRTDTRSVIGAQYSANPKSSQTHLAAVNLVTSYATISPEIARDILETLFETCPDVYCEVAAEKGLSRVAEAAEDLRSRQSNALTNITNLFAAGEANG